MVEFAYFDEQLLIWLAREYRRIKGFHGVMKMDFEFNQSGNHKMCHEINHFYAGARTSHRYIDQNLDLKKNRQKRARKEDDKNIY